MKYSKEYLQIHGLLSQGESVRFISDRFQISRSTVYRVKSYKQKTISKRSIDKIQSNYKKLKNSKKKSDKLILFEIDNGFELLKSSKTKKDIFTKIKKVKKAKSTIKQIADELLKQDKRRKKGKGKKYKNSWYGKFMTEYYESLISVEVK